MKINDAGLKLIKSFEGCRLTAYKAVPTEKYYTIGWGHYGADVSKDEKWTQARADEQLNFCFSSSSKPCKNLASILIILR